MVVEIKHTFERCPDDYSNPITFPALGFEGEQCYSMGDVILYECEFKRGRIVIWRQRQRDREGGGIVYALNLYTQERTDKSATHYEDRYDRHQEPIIVADALEAQLAIFHLLQKHNLPCEVTPTEDN